VAASGEVYDAVTSAGPFVHGFTYSHNPVGAAVAREVLRILEAERLVEASASKGIRLRALLEDVLDGRPGVGDIRGAGLLAGIELVADVETRRPFPRAAGVTEAVVRAARERGLIVYSSTGCADGVDGDLIVLGPPFVVTDTELVQVAETLREAIAEAVAGVSTAAV
jgi:adenosylmethionine-8-amino-7-oxononanoate aminotransferase